MLDNTGVRGQLLFAPSSRRSRSSPSFDHTRQRPDGYAQVVAGVAPTLRPANRQWAAIAADLHYAPPSDDAFDRLVDTDTAWRSTQDLGGASLTADWTVGRRPGHVGERGRYWNWDPSNDRDFTGLPVTTISAATSKQRQWTQEFRWAGDLAPSLQLVTGVFAFHQSIDSDPTFKQEQGAAAARVLLAPTAAAADAGPAGRLRVRPVPELPQPQHGRRSRRCKWSLTDRLTSCRASGSTTTRRTSTSTRRSTADSQTTNPALIALQRSILAPQAYTRRRRRHELVGTADGRRSGLAAAQRLRDRRHRLQVRRPQPERAAHRRVEPADPRDRAGPARARAAPRARPEDASRSAASPPT